MHKADRTGQVVGVGGCLTAIEPAGSNARGAALWRYRCSICGGTRVLVPGNAERQRSCGCLESRHGMTGSLTHHSWTAMRGRCLTPSNADYATYGGAGITICPEWDSFERFLEDMGERPNKSHSLDRIDGATVYSKETCRWATKTDQSINRSNTVFVTVGDETLCIAEWARRLDMEPSAVHSRIARGWSPQRAVTEPPKRKRAEEQINRQSGELFPNAERPSYR
jgi:hypothetical protein